MFFLNDIAFNRGVQGYRSPVNPKIIQIDPNSLGWIIYVFGSKSNRIDHNRSYTGWITSLDL